MAKILPFRSKTETTESIDLNNNTQSLGVPASVTGQMLAASVPSDVVQRAKAELDALFDLEDSDGSSDDITTDLQTTTPSD